MAHGIFVHLFSEAVVVVNRNGFFTMYMVEISRKKCNCMRKDDGLLFREKLV